MKMHISFSFVLTPAFASWACAGFECGRSITVGGRYHWLGHPQSWHKGEGYVWNHPQNWCSWSWFDVVGLHTNKLWIDSILWCDNASEDCSECA
jgi:hypothetical protein